MIKEKSKLITVLTVFLYSITLNINSVFCQVSTKGIFDNNSDIGAVKLPGDVIYNPALQEYTMHGSGENIWFGRDEFHFLWKSISKNIVFLSFRKEVSADDHPFYKHVYIRMMPAEGGEPEIIACVYGGQGTINVNSWSPDSRKIAFISNTEIYELCLLICSI